MPAEIAFPLRQLVLRREKSWGELTATDTALFTNLWHIEWGDVEAIWIGQLASGQPALMIRPKQRSDLRMKGSKLSRLGISLDALVGVRNVSLAEALFDRPLEAVIEALSAKSGKPFGEPPGNRSS